MRNEENLCSVDIMEIVKLTQEAVAAHPERTKQIMRDFSKICRRNNKYTDLDIILGGKNNG
jgi:hypothetical protein